MIDAFELGFDVARAGDITIGEMTEVELDGGLKAHHSSGTSSIVIARLPRSMVEAKCHGASRCVVLWVESRIHSIAQPSRSGKSSSRKPGKNLTTSAAVCRWVK